MKRDEENRYGVRSVERAIDILRCFSFDENLKLGEISARIGVPKSTVHRIVSSLEEAHFITQDPETGKYGLGFELIRLGNVAQEKQALSRIIRPEMQILSNQTGQTSNLYRIQGFGRLCIDQVEGPEYIRRHSYLGASHPLYCGASGRVLLAFSSDEFVDEFFRTVKLEKVTERTITDPVILRRVLLETKKTGYALSLAERDPFSGSIAAPILGVDRTLVAAITLSGPVEIFTEENVARFSKELLESSRRISEKLMGVF